MSTFNHKSETLFFEGELSKFSVPKLLSLIKKQKLTGIQKVDLSAVTSIDSAGVAFIDFVNELCSKEKAVSIINIPSSITSSIETFSYSYQGNYNRSLDQEKEN